ncbi:MAG: 7,8-dihydropterin-6-yl-methyl-4-(beta-D-ribofuranosyl)aminobenzene 5-phosphate synthase [Thermotogota bacterium]|nr:7,8-dihydropterin-6-yl-methyl-4-(beta-D-ribofuranosyl)aminobenzene 5-phosphate synthase [Thermotogota bacterium]
MKLTILCNDRARAPMIAEHGFSVLLEASDDRHVLFDTGASDVFMKNAKLLKIDLSGITDVVLSHGHYDHVGGLKDLLLKVRPRIWVRREIAFLKYSKARYIGPSYSWNEIEEAAEHIKYVNDHIEELSDSVFVWGPARMGNSFEEPDSEFLVRKEKTVKRDYFEEELNLTVRSSKGLVVITGCAHRGIINIITEAAQLFRDQIYMVLGGFHLRNAPLEKIQWVTEKFNQLDIKRLVPCHCTGREAIQLFKKHFEGEVLDCYVGAEMMIE